MNLVVLSLDAGDLEAGFAGEYNPLFSSRADETVKVFSQESSRHWDYNLFETEDTEYTRGKEYILFKQMCEIFQKMFCKLCIPPNGCKLLLVLRESCPLWLNCMLHECLLGRFRVHSIGCIPASLASCVGAGAREGLVIQFNWHSIDVVPVYDYRIIHNYLKSTTRGSGSDLAACVKASGDDSLTSGIFQERLFPQEEAKNFDADEQPLGSLLQTITGRLPIDLREPLSKNLIIMGRITNDQEIKNVLTKQLGPCNIVSTMGPWSGASLYLATHASEIKFLKRDYYLKNGVKDWVEHIYDSKASKFS